ncbi:cytochrome P450 [Aspergillus bertholletiae]|uniref:Cytochrome P450 n=1 Tax=Aspergillus bertholletiae TaxID=1226010 RepID=A0A5N7BKU5_9EURO|nr:cytochrome P450 [Aspergillus bertholletiae]
MSDDLLRSVASADPQDITPEERIKLHRALYLLLSLLFAWRLWTFTVSPRLNRGRLEYLPYWIPYLGHAIPFFRNSSSLFARAKKEFDHKLCALRIAGQDMVMVTTATQIAAIDRDSQTFAFEPFVDLVYDEIATVSRESKPLLWKTPAEGYKSLFPSSKQMTAAHTGIHLLHKQLTQPDAMQRFMTTSLLYVHKTLQWDSFYKTSVLASTADVKIVSLGCLCRDVIIDAQLTSFFGRRILDLEPNIRSILQEWDALSWQVSYKLPSFLAKHAMQLRDHLIEVLVKYYASPVEQRPGSVAFVNDVYNDYKQAGIPDRDIAGIVFTILWGLNSNVNAISYWMIAHLANNPTVVHEIREEIAPMMRALDSAPTIDGAILVEVTKEPLLNGCPILNSTFNETLRFTATGSSFRETTRDTTLEGRYIPKGTRIIMPQRTQMMHSPAFGPDPERFDCYRFYRNKSLLRKVEFRGFGGGTTLCSGRIVGRHLVLAYVAILLWKYDVEVIESGQEVLGVRGKGFPRLDEAKPSLGPGKPKEGDDQILRLTHRKVSGP